MAKPNDGFKGDLDGTPTPHAKSMRCGVCKCGYLIDVDLLDAAGKTIAHGHLDIETALEFADRYHEAIEELVATRAAAH